MSVAFSFHTQLVSIMDALSKTAVMEISKLVEIESKMLKIEITRGRNEIASLTEKLQLMEKLLYIAQGGRQEAAAAAACTVVRDAAANGLLVEPERTRPAVVKSEIQWESRSSSTDMCSLRVEEQVKAEKLPNPHKVQPDLIVVKEEPKEVDIGDTQRDRRTENRRDSVTNSQTSSDAMQRPRPNSERHHHHHHHHPQQQQPLFSPESLVSLGSPSSLAGALSRERQWNHLLPPSNPSGLEVGKCIAQNIASQSLSVLRNMKLHNLRNSGTKRFPCQQCGKSFRSFSQLEIHQRSHTGEKPFVCTLCGKRYAQKGHLYTHKRTHTGEKPYRCPICGKGFIQKCTLDMHQRTHTGEKPFVCMKCGKGFTKNCNLKKHLAVHLDPSLSLFDGDGPTFSATLINGTS